jgi:hypothetical protein
VSPYTGQIGQILRVYTQRMKIRSVPETNQKMSESDRDTVSLSMSAQQKSKLEQLALQNMNRITRKHAESYQNEFIVNSNNSFVLPDRNE